MVGGIMSALTRWVAGGLSRSSTRCYTHVRMDGLTHQLLQCYMLAAFDGSPYPPRMVQISPVTSWLHGASAW